MGFSTKIVTFGTVLSLAVFPLIAFAVRTKRLESDSLEVGEKWIRYCKRWDRWKATCDDIPKSYHFLTEFGPEVTEQLVQRWGANPKEWPSWHNVLSIISGMEMIERDKRMIWLNPPGVYFCREDAKLEEERWTEWWEAHRYLDEDRGSD